MDFNIDTKGIEQINKVFSKLDPKDQKRVIEAGIKSAVRPVIKQAKTNYTSSPHPYSTGQNRPASSIRSKSYKDGIGVRTKPNVRKGGSLTHLLDLGWVHYKSGKRIRGSHFWSGAIARGKKKVLKDSGEETIKALDRMLKSLIKKYGKIQ